ncbi:helix-turn-helix transcriptional regulator [Actinomadura madurae]|uniref:helix-turn-helix transcriptional regulator n=1 Tax=Actinomadura madurae TaxID=1993 RepID=UPI0020D1FBE2|nr:helix-turn-helix transcriptional regulator [Actinomadura madurae]MCP9947201.1 transcriptional regulator [Actinomadura madurae]MCP9976441.1 transcriptional regulator [Actinomadura madurae]MCQ0012066.1 transcriptional regulator [Actinomadura madurae]MCQ0012633.1 transcriptional regulator [Actinomadura madurae]
MGDPELVARALHKRRLTLGLSRVEVADRVGYGTAAVKGWELGARGMSLAQAYAYGAVLGVRPVLEAGERVPVPLAACPVRVDRIPPVLAQLRATRLVRELSFAAVAARIGLAATTVLYWETGDRGIALARAHDYADALGLVLTVGEISPSVSALVEAGGRPSGPGGGPRMRSGAA